MVLFGIRPEIKVNDGRVDIAALAISLFNQTPQVHLDPPTHQIEQTQISTFLLSPEMSNSPERRKKVKRGSRTHTCTHNRGKILTVP